MKRLLKNRYVRIRKSQVCHGCGYTFMKGAELRYQVEALDKNHLFYTYWCEVCDTYIRRYLHPYDQFELGELRTADPDGWKEIEKEIKYNATKRMEDSEVEDELRTAIL